MDGAALWVGRQNSLLPAKYCGILRYAAEGFNYYLLSKTFLSVSCLFLLSCVLVV